MRAQTNILIGIASALLGLSTVLEQTSESVALLGRGQAATSATQGGQYVFVLFHKEGDAAKLTMWQTLKAALAKLPGQAMAVIIRVNDPAMKPVVDRHGVSRSPLPLVLAIAPNCAVTGAFAVELTEQDVADAIVSPSQADCMREEQTRQCVSLSAASATAPWPTISTWYLLACRPAISNPTIVSRCCSCFKSSAARERPSPLIDPCLLVDKRSCLDENPLEPHPWPMRTGARRLDIIRSQRGAN